MRNRTQRISTCDQIWRASSYFPKIPLLIANQANTSKTHEQQLAKLSAIRCSDNGLAMLSANGRGRNVDCARRSQDREDMRTEGCQNPEARSHFVSKVRPRRTNPHLPMPTESVELSSYARKTYNVDTDEAALGNMTTKGHVVGRRKNSHGSGKQVESDIWRDSGGMWWS